MRSSARPQRAIDVPSEHAERVCSVVEVGTLPFGIEDVSASWQRSAIEHGVDPLRDDPPRILSSRELKDLREPVGNLIFSAQDELDRLYKMVREAGYTLLFCVFVGAVGDH